MGDGLMVFLLVVYAVICLTFLYEGNIPKACYWLGAFIITSSVICMR